MFGGNLGVGRFEFPGRAKHVCAIFCRGSVHTPSRYFQDLATLATGLKASTAIFPQA